MLSFAHARSICMEQKYWLERKRLSLAKAQTATHSEARLIHFDLAGRYSVKAADAGSALKEAVNDQ